MCGLNKRVSINKLGTAIAQRHIVLNILQKIVHFCDLFAYTTLPFAGY